MAGSLGNTRGKRVFLYVFLVFFLVMAGSVLYTAYHWKKMTAEWYQPLSDEPQAGSNQILEGISKPGTPSVELYTKAQPLEPFTILLIGIDSRDGEKARSDTMILATVHPSRQRAYLLSIPRDSYMNLPQRGYDKVNHAMAFGGPAMVKKTLEQFFEIKVDRYMTIDFDGFRKVVDELGGVEVHVKKRMKYTDPTDNTDIDLQPGTQTLNGEQALDYARYRKSDIGPEDSDYDRIVRQQEIIKALANKGDSVQAFLKAFKLMDIMGKHIKTDLTEQEIASLLVTYYDPKRNTLETDTLRGADERIWHNGIRGWYYLVPKKERIRIHERIQQELVP